MLYSGYEELKKYIEDSDAPTFEGFLRKHLDSIALWSLEDPTDSCRALHGRWIKRFDQVMSDVDEGKKSTKRTTKRRKLNELTWNLIVEKMNSYERARHTYEIEAGKLLVSAAPSVSKSVSSLFTSSELNKQPELNEQPEQDKQTEQPKLDEESGTLGDSTFSFMYKFGVKKFQGKLVEDDYVKILLMKTNGDTVDDRIKNYVIKLLCKQSLCPVEQENLKLLLSKVINLMNPDIYAAIELVLSGQQLQRLQSKNLPIVDNSLDQASSTLLDEVLDDHATNLKDLRLKIQHEKIRLIQSGDMDSDSYKLLRVIEDATDTFGDKLDEASELTIYWKFAKLLHIILKDLDINMVDGETISSATKLAMEPNETLYGCDATTSFGRKIDLLLKIDGPTTIELSLSEWKNRKTMHMALKQQSKKLRTNCTILNKLQIISDSKITKLMAMDFVGTTGYLYQLEFKNNMYIPSLLSELILPTNINQMDQFKDTIKALFMFKNFLADVTSDVKRHLDRQQFKRNFHAMVRPLLSEHNNKKNTSSFPAIFFTPKNCRIKDVPLDSLDEDD
ncbi:uncharacterized protein BX664DRAFT_358771 [Halteromyces radiatus]|uniref:uncharacterized protein n=1 Tax=Halteromyces radiatus TaxID=101107 RepID=UPI0022203B56|nr:uncharacterized protein BX664DRAFT_358771 [Halteromyces radiatus]KAI8089196.1 hypothetical protein BX664DRAFT_358771 [Halteromyces radiatus]